MKFIYSIALILFVSPLFAQIPTGYYNTAAGLTKAPLKAALNNIIKGHTGFPYTSSSTDVWDILSVIDEDPNNSSNIIMIYTGRSEPKVNKASGSASSNQNYWNREHVWAQSHGGFGTSTGAGTDVHHLKPSDVSVNSARGNLDFDNGGSPHSEATGCNFDSNSWEPRDEVKGDVARMIFYMATRYEGAGSEPDLEVNDLTSNSSTPLHGKLSTLVQWHYQDTVDAFEKNRNNLIYYNYQGNRNPYIDHPEYASFIFDSNYVANTVDPEPTHHVTDFKALKSATIDWTDATGAVLPTGYLVVLSELGFNQIQSPVDGVTATNYMNTKVVPYGTQTATFGLLKPGTNYFFKVFSYTGSGATTNYKTIGSIPSIMVTTTN